MKIRKRKSTLKKKKTSGFRARMKTKSGREVINRRRRKGVKKLTTV